jgi:hypothetical protein
LLQDDLGLVGGQAGRGGGSEDGGHGVPCSMYMQ